MDLLDLTKDLFSYLVLFREKVGTAASPSLEEVRRDLDGIFRRMDNETRKRPSLASPYSQVKYALAAFADEVILSSDWDQASAWEAQLLELEFFGTNVAGDRFFELMASLDDAPRLVVAVYFRCLALGFSGRYMPGSDELEQAKRGLLARLKIPSPEYAGRLAPQGYEGVMTERTRLGRLMSWRFGLLLVLGLALGLFFFDRFVLWPWLTRGVGQVSDMATTRLKQSALESLAARKADNKARKGAQDKAKADQISKQTPAKSLSPSTKERPAKAEGVSMLAKPSAGKPASKDLSPQDELWQKGYLVQVGSFVGEGSAERMADRLAEAGLPSWTAKKPRGEGKVWHVVLVGPYPKFTQAQQVKTRLADRLNLMPVIVDALEFRAGAEEKSQAAPQKGGKVELTPAEKPEKKAAAKPAPKEHEHQAVPLYREKTKPRTARTEASPKPAAQAPKATKNPQSAWKMSVGDENKDAAAVAAESWDKGFLVQLGAFVGPKDSERLAARVAGSGFEVWVVTRPRQGKKDWYLVVCGPFQKYPEAKSALSSLEREYALKPIIVDAKDHATFHRKMVSGAGKAKKSLPAAKKSVAPERLWANGFLVQVGVFVGPRDADRLLKQLDEVGVEAMVLDRPRSQGKVWHVVLTGPYATSPQAGKVQAEIESKIGLRPIIVDAREFAGSRR